MTTNIKSKTLESERLKLPLHAWFGLGLVVLFWILNWTLTGARTHWGFFPLWLGYCLTIDGLVFWRTGTSLLTRSPRKYIGLFLISAPVWWIFELLNVRTQNWTYIGAEIFSPLEYAFWTTLSFTTVIPAVFGSAELFASFDFVKRFKRGPVIGAAKKTALIFFAARLDHAPPHADLARHFLPIHLAVPLLYPRTHQHLAAESFPCRLDPKWGLAPCHFIVAWRFAYGVLLGDVELLFLPKMDLPRDLGRRAARIRNAFARLWRLSSLRARTLRLISLGNRIIWKSDHRLCTGGFRINGLFIKE